MSASAHVPAALSRPYRLSYTLPVAAVFGVLAGCARPALVPLHASAVEMPLVFSRTANESSGNPPTVVVRDYWGAPAATVVAWSPDDDSQGLRTAVRRNGSIVHDHEVYLSTYALPNYKAFSNAEWHAFANRAIDNSVNGSNGSNKGNSQNKELVNDRNNDLAQVLQVNGVTRDIMNCKGTKACSPYESFSARISDSMLRSAADSLVIKVRARNGSEEVVNISHDLIKAYLKTVDSLSNSRRFVHEMTGRR